MIHEYRQVGSMSFFCKLEDLRNESDVEQKLIWPLFTSPEPTGLGYAPSDIYTKPNIKYLAIEKGTAEKVYRPDYIILMAGFPLVVIEAKHPKEDLNEALREARLYAAELNSFHPPGINPCYRIVVSNGKKIISSASDSQEIDFEIDFHDINLGSARYHEFLTLLKRSALQDRADDLRHKLAKTDFQRPTHLLGGLTVRNEEVGYNEFGARIALDFLHIFNPQSRKERAHVVRNAYVSSRRRQHYVEEIDRVIRSTLPSPLPGSTLVEDTSSPVEIIRALQRGRELHHKMFLLVGPVGSGKSTFVDYFREVKLPEEVRKVTVWVSVDLNDAPVRRELIDDWVLQEIIRNLRNTKPEIDFDQYENIEKVFAVELSSLRKGALARTPKDSQKYTDAISDEMRKLMSDKLEHTKALARHLCNERGKLLVLVLDNCDKGDRAEQLAMFQTVRWIQSWLKCLVFLPIRDVTYHTSKNQPPLDTVIKDFVFRIETPSFTEVLDRRIKLAFTELMAQSSKSERYEYGLQSGMRVVYPATELGLYLACIFKSLYEHDRLLRRMLVGLAGKNIRRAMEIFLDFCKSGHIGEKEYLKIRTSKGNYPLPYHLVTRVLLRLNRRFYDGDLSHVKNVFQCNSYDPKPNHFTRLAILLWLQQHFHDVGPTGIRGFHRCDRILTELIPFGHDAQRIREDMHYLVEAMCILTEHQRTEELSDEDLVCLSPAGFAHLSITSNLDYLAACAEDSWITNPRLAHEIAERIGQYGRKFHYTRETMRKNAGGFVDYLVDQSENEVARPFDYLEGITEAISEELRQIRGKVARWAAKEYAEESWPAVDDKFIVGGTYEGTINAIKDFGAFILLDGGPIGLLHFSKMPRNRPLETLKVGERIKVIVLAIDRRHRHLALGFFE